MQLKKPFIRLPFNFDAKTMAAEANALSPDAWLAHPSRLQGNSAVPLISRHGGHNDCFDGPMAITEHLSKCEYIRQVIASFNEVFGRSRLMKLDAGAQVSQHIDFNYHWHRRIRIHIPITTTPEVRFYCGNADIHMGAGECWLFDSWRRHRVINSSDKCRIHLVLDTAGSSKFWRLVHSLESTPLTKNEDYPELPYHPGQQVSLQTENYNVAPVMSPGEVDGLVEELVRDFSANGENDPTLVAKYRDLLQEFSYDWRAVWHSFGPHRDGWPHYRQLIQAAAKTICTQTGVQ